MWEALWRQIDLMDPRVVVTAAFNAGVVWILLKRYVRAEREQRRYKSWSLPLLTKIKAFHEARHPNEDLGEDWDEEGGR